MPNGRSLPTEFRAKLLLLNDFQYVDRLISAHELSTSRRGWTPNVINRTISAPTPRKREKERKERPNRQADRSRVSVSHLK